MSFLMKKLQAPKGTISVTLDKGEYSLREPLTGKINVTATEDFDVDEIRLELVVQEWTKATQNINIGGNSKPVTAEQNNKVHDGKITLQGRTHLTNGSNVDFPFSVNFPSGVPSTYRGINCRNTWKIKGVMAVKGRPDITGHEIELQVNA